MQHYYRQRIINEQLIMNIYVAFLRAINVGGRNVIKMSELKECLEAVQLKHIQTFLQSGNVVFESELEDAEKLQVLIQTAIEFVFGHSVPVIIRTLDEMETILASQPFADYASLPKDKIFINYLQNAPTETTLASFKPIYAKGDVFKIDGKNIFLYCQNPYNETKLQNGFFEKKLLCFATTRNFNTSTEILNIMRRRVN